MFRVKCNNPYLNNVVRIRSLIREFRCCYRCDNKGNLPPCMKFGSAALLSHRPYAVVYFSCITRHLVDEKDGYKWNIIIKWLLEERKLLQSILVFSHARRKGLTVDSHTLRLVVRSCSAGPWISVGRAVHGQILKLGFNSLVILQTELLQMYDWSKDLESVKNVFDETSNRDLPFWNAFIKVYGRADQPDEALELLCAMIEDNLRPNVVTAVSIISACSSLRTPNLGKLLHGFFIKVLSEFDVFVYNSLIEIYIKSGCLSLAARVFDLMPERNVVTWTTMLNGYVENNFPMEAFTLFRKMVNENVKPDEVAVLGLLCACSKLGNFGFSEILYCYISKIGLEDSIKISNALIDMLSKCGNIEKSCRVFDSIRKKNLITWTTMIQGLAVHGQGVAALVRFTQMQREGFKPDEIVFISILFACCHDGLVQEARICFTSMVEEYKLIPWIDHYGCMVDLLCRAGQIDEAFTFVEHMPVEPDEKICRILLSVCDSTGDIGIARKFLTRLLELEPNCRSNFTLISNLYAKNFEWTKVKEIRKEMGRKTVTEGDSGHSLVEV